MVQPFRLSDSECDGIGACGSWPPEMRGDLDKDRRASKSRVQTRRRQGLSLCKATAQCSARVLSAHHVLV